nr:TBC1 domain family member 30-like [Lytechinus pictus]
MQWYDALRAVARLPFGLPRELRKAVWLSLADKHIKHLKLDWEKTVKVAFNDHSNPDDDKLGVQIVKDLHRTGCSGFCGQGAEEDRVVLKRVLLAYARWNKSVGYCQGFNVIAALILEVMERMEDDALKVMIFLIDHVLPDSYFANNLRALSVDMAVFRELLHFKLPDLAQHLDKLQKSANDGLSGSYEPPLTNVFTMQWFLTLFATCVPKKLVLRVWDTLFLEGSEVLLRVALAIWAKLEQPLLEIKSADEFYSQMAVLCSEMLQDQLIDGDDLVKMIYSMASFPFPHLNEIREKYMFSITPFSPLGGLEKTSTSSETKSTTVGPKRKEGQRGYSQPSSSHASQSDEETEFIDDEDLTNMTCFTGLFPPQSPYAITDGGDRSESQGSAGDDITKVSPGAYSTSSEDLTLHSAALMERMTMDVQSLKKQYLRIQRRQMRAHVIYGPTSIAGKRAHKPVSRKKNIAVAIESPAVVNHLLVGKGGLGKKNAKIASTPQIAPPSRKSYDDDDDDFPSKRVHVNTKPNVKHLTSDKDESKNDGGRDDMSELSSVFEDNEDISAVGCHSSSRDDLTKGHQDSLSNQDEKTWSQESLEPEIGSLIDLGWGSDGESHTNDDQRENVGLDTNGIERVMRVNDACDSASESQDLNANDVTSNRPRQHLDSDKTLKSTSTESIPSSMLAPEFNCSIAAFNPNLPSTSPRRQNSKASEPTSPSQEKPWITTNGTVADQSHVSVSTSWRRCSSGSSSCDEPTTPPARVVFNPFPKRSLKSSESRTRTRMKLGLYPKKTNEKRQGYSTRDASAEQLSHDIARSIQLGS